MIKVNFKAYGSYETDRLYQWDSNQVLKVTGISLPTATEIHFTNRLMDKAIVKTITRTDDVITCDIPNTLLQVDEDIIAYVGLYEGNTFKTVEKIRIPMIKRPRPEDYVFTDTDKEVYSYRALEAKVNASVNDLNNAMDLVGDINSLVVNKVNTIASSIVDNKVNEALSDVTTLVEEMEELKPITIWSNASPTSAFEPQTVVCNLSDAKYIEVEYIYSTTDNQAVQTIKFENKVGNTAYPLYHYNVAMANFFGLTFRTVCVRENGLEFLMAYQKRADVKTTTPLTTHCIPIRIRKVV